MHIWDAWWIIRFVCLLQQTFLYIWNRIHLNICLTFKTFIVLQCLFKLKAITFTKFCMLIHYTFSITMTIGSRWTGSSQNTCTSSHIRLETSTKTWRLDSSISCVEPISWRVIINESSLFTFILYSLLVNTYTLQSI